MIFSLLLLVNYYSMVILVLAFVMCTVDDFGLYNLTKPKISLFGCLNRLGNVVLYRCRRRRNVSNAYEQALLPYTVTGRSK